jgi:2-keto-4-pentenoate hydratase/2-oxohepta-3-ene-1,7-dioic acid hydratase in catechol pathway
MRITRFIDEHSVTQFGIDRSNGTAELLEGSIYDKPRSKGKVTRIVTRLAPVQPANIFCIGLNYKEHARETGAALPTQPVIFMKPTSALNHPDAPIRIPACCRSGPEVDFECELAVVIGKRAKNVTVERALDYGLGYTCANDVSARKWQKNGGGGQWIRGKGFDTFCPLGPVLVTAGTGVDEINDPQNLHISTRVNGIVMQDLTTSDMIFSVAQVISFLSMDTTLEPGTVILTGTPQGVGFARTPPVFLQPGDEVMVEIERIGQLRNPVMADV